MKYYSASICLPCLLVALCSGAGHRVWGQTRPAVAQQAPRRLIYTAVVPVAAVSQADLVLRAQAWARLVTPASLRPISTRDSATATLRTTGSCPFAYEQENLSGKTLLATLRYNATISVREGRYQYEVTDFVFGFPGSRRYPDSEIPVESFFNGNVKPLRAEGFRYNMTMRTCFKELADEVLARLQASMRKPTSKVGTE